MDANQCADVFCVVSCDLVLSSCEILPSGHSVVSKKAQMVTAIQSKASSEATRSIKDFTDPRIDATIGHASSALKWLVRHAAWTLTAFHDGGDGMTAHQRTRGTPFHSQHRRSSVGTKPRKTGGPRHKLTAKKGWTDAGLGSARALKSTS